MMPRTMKRMFPIRAVASQWSVSEQTVRRLIVSGELGTTRIGGQLRVPAEEIHRYEQAHRE